MSRNSGSDGAEESPSSDAQLTDENTADDETWNEIFRDSSDVSTSGDVALLRDPPNYYEAVQYLHQVAHTALRGRIRRRPLLKTSLGAQLPLSPISFLNSLLILSLSPSLPPFILALSRHGQGVRGLFKLPQRVWVEPMQP